MKAESRSVSVVMVGTFKPSDFNIESLAKAKALSGSDSANAAYTLLVKDQAVEIALQWGRLTVVADRLSVELSSVPYIRAADLVSKCMREISPASVSTKLGVNVVSHYQFGSMRQRDEFAMRLVPPPAWGEFGTQVIESMGHTDDRHGGLVDVTVRRGRPDDRQCGWIDARVTRSTKVPGDVGAAVSINDHYECLNVDASGAPQPPRLCSERLIEVVESKFDAAIERAIRFSDGIVAERGA